MKAYCHTCGKEFDQNGIASHRAAHKRNGEACEVTIGNTTTTHTPDDKPDSGVRRPGLGGK